MSLATDGFSAMIRVFPMRFTKCNRLIGENTSCNWAGQWPKVLELSKAKTVDQSFWKTPSDNYYRDLNIENPNGKNSKHHSKKFKKSLVKIFAMRQPRVPARKSVFKYRWTSRPL